MATVPVRSTWAIRYENRCGLLIGRGRAKVHPGNCVNLGIVPTAFLYVRTPFVRFVTIPQPYEEKVSNTSWTEKYFHVTLAL